MKPYIVGAAKSLSIIDQIGEEGGHGPVSPLVDEVLDEEEGKLEEFVGALVGPLVVDYLLRHGLDGVELDRDEPFSDASISNALSQVLGVQVATVRNRESLKNDMWAAAALRVSQITGGQFEDLRSRELVKRDALRAAGKSAGDIVPGLELRDLSSRAQTLADIELYATRLVSDLTGIRFTSLRSRQAIKEDLYAWAEPHIREQIDGELAASNAVKPLKMDKKSVKNRQAQARFRAKHGPRKSYERYVGLWERQQSNNGGGGK